MNKPVVHFAKSEGVFAEQILKGTYTYEVFALDHPRLGKQWVRTSTVLSEVSDEEGNIIQFETLNTIYKAQ